MCVNGVSYAFSGSAAGMSLPFEPEKVANSSFSVAYSNVVSQAHF